MKKQIMGLCEVSQAALEKIAMLVLRNDLEELNELQEEKNGNT